jgi:hypothetical protein
VGTSQAAGVHAFNRHPWEIKARIDAPMQQEPMLNQSVVDVGPHDITLGVDAIGKGPKSVNTRRRFPASLIREITESI